jgi:hypothetical protein
VRFASLASGWKEVLGEVLKSTIITTTTSFEREIRFYIEMWRSAGGAGRNNPLPGGAIASRAFRLSLKRRKDTTLPREILHAVIRRCKKNKHT